MHAKEWVMGLYWWPQEAKSVLLIHLAHSLSEPMPSETVTHPWVFSMTWRTPPFLWSSHSVKVRNVVSLKTALKELLCHKARHEWVMNCTHEQDCFPQLDSVHSLDHDQPCELKLYSVKARVCNSCWSELSHSRALLWGEVLFNYRKPCTKKLHI